MTNSFVNNPHPEYIQYSEKKPYNRCLRHLPNGLLNESIAPCGRSAQRQPMTRIIRNTCAVYLNYFIFPFLKPMQLIDFDSNRK
jgi:hypothetical protein